MPIVRTMRPIKPFLMREDMFDGAAHFRLLRIGEARALRHRLALGLLAMNARDEAAPRQHRLVLRRAIGGVRTDVARRVGSIENLLQPGAVMRGGVRRRPFADQPMRPVDRDMVLVTERRDGEIDRRNRSVFPHLGFRVFDRPARIAILLRELLRLVLPVVGNAAVLDRLLLLDRVALLGRGDDRRVDDLAAHRQKAGVAQRRVESLEQGVNRVRLLQRLAKRPDRIGVGNRVGQPQSEEAHERQPVLDQIFAALVRQRMHRLQDQHLEHEHMIERRPTALRAVAARDRRFQRRPEHLEIDQTPSRARDRRPWPTTPPSVRRRQKIPALPWPCPRSPCDMTK